GDRFYDLKTGRPYHPASGLFSGPEFTLTAPDGTVYQLRTAGGVEEQITPNGTRLLFSDSGIASSTGESILFVHDAAGPLSSVTLPDGSRVVYSYDEAGNLVAARDLAQGQRHRYGYSIEDAH